MRHALSIAVINLVVSGSFVGGVYAADVRPYAAFTPPAISSGASILDDDRGLLPIRGSSLPMSGAVDSNGDMHNAPQGSIIEAIPTPTAFHTGVVLLAIIFAGRNFRKLFSRFVAA